MRFKLTYILVVASAIAACKKPYVPDVVASNNNYLVVEGVINAGSDSTIIKLSRTVNVDQKAVNNPETKAQLQVEDESKKTFILTESTPGTYFNAALNLDKSKKYRLSIKTATGAQYYSDYVPVLVSPAIDSVSYKPADDKLNISVTTHSADNSVSYYRYDYVETWEFHVMYASQWEAKGGAIVPRDIIFNDVFTCWATKKSNNVVLGSTAGLAQSILYQAPVTYVQSTDEKIGTRYSILIRQYALTKDEYNFWQQLKKNTESLGSIFDAFPSGLQGNIHNAANPAENVIGYIGASTSTSNRILIAKSQLPPQWVQPNPFNCQLDTILPRGYGVFFSTPPVKIPIKYLATIGGYTASSPECSDCTTRGVNKRPSYWP